jgi:predicted secreted protein
MSYIENDDNLKGEIGEIFSISLPEFSSSGFLWEINYPENSIEIITNETIISDNIGGIATKIYEFKILTVEPIEIILEHKRPWNDEIHAIRKIKIN